MRFYSRSYNTIPICYNPGTATIKIEPNPNNLYMETEIIDPTQIKFGINAISVK